MPSFIRSAFQPKSLIHRWASAWAIALLATTGSPQAATFQLEIDYMGPDADLSHDHKPSQKVLDAVIQMFACQGHTLIIDLDDQIAHSDTLARDEDCDELFDYDDVPNSFGKIRDQYFDHGSGWHYGLFVHQYMTYSSSLDQCVLSGSSGLSDGESRLVVSLGKWDNETGTEFEQAGTLAHEFGHNLGLSHCANNGLCSSNDDPTDPAFVGPRVPNLASIMTYYFQTRGVKSNMLAMGLAPSVALFKDLDYSGGRMCGLDESDLDERAGSGMTSVDWDCDGTLETSVAQEINGSSSSGWCGDTGNQTVLQDYNEWNNLSDVTYLLGSRKPEDLEFRRRRLKPVEPCVSYEEWTQYRDEQGLDEGPDLTIEPCLKGLNVYVGWNPIPWLNVGICNFPYDGVREAHDEAPEGSVFYLDPSSYDEGTTLLRREGLYTCYTGAALVH